MAAFLKLISPSQTEIQQALAYEGPVTLEEVEEQFARSEAVEIFKSKGQLNPKTKQIEFNAVVIINQGKEPLKVECIVRARIIETVGKIAIQILFPSQLCEHLINHSLANLDIFGLNQQIKRVQDLIKDKKARALKKQQEDEKRGIKQKSNLLKLLEFGEISPATNVGEVFEEVIPFLSTLSLTRLTQVSKAFHAIFYDDPVWLNIHMNELKVPAIPQKYAASARVDRRYLFKAVKEAFCSQKKAFREAFAPFLKTYTVGDKQIVGLNCEFLWELPKLNFDRTKKDVTEDEARNLPSVFTFQAYEAEKGFYGIGIKYGIGVCNDLKDLFFDFYILENKKWKLWLRFNKGRDGLNDGIIGKEDLTDFEFNYLIKLLRKEACGNVYGKKEFAPNWEGNSVVYMVDAKFLHNLKKDKNQ